MSTGAVECLSFDANNAFGRRDLASRFDTRQFVPALIIGGALAAAGTSSAESTALWINTAREPDATTCGLSTSQSPSVAMEAAVSTSTAVAELRRLSGLTWDQLAELFGVSRRSIHFWASGKQLSSDNEQRLLRVLDVIRSTDKGNARSNRTALLEVNRGSSAINLLAAKRYEEAQRMLGTGMKRRSPQREPLNAQAKGRRAPLRPEELLVELRETDSDEQVATPPAHTRTARVVRTTRRDA